MPKNLLEICQIAPPPHTVTDQSLPLTFLDLMSLPDPPFRRLLFYELPDSSKPYFFETLLPKLKQSLSLSLKHFFPLAGRVVYPINSEKKPEIRYRAGDSVSVTFFESSVEFDYIVGNHARDADKFYDFVPFLSNITDEEESDQLLLDALAIQVTLFPGRGLCIGLSARHGVGDATSMMGFIKSWALINKKEGDKDGEFEFCSPVFDRYVIKYPLELDSVFLNQIKNIPIASPTFPLPTNRVRATFTFTQSEINKLKDLVQTRFPRLGHVSSFVVVSAYVWNCLAKSFTEEKVNVADDEPELFLFYVDLRGRINPPVPGNYFGNCVTHGLSRIQHQELVGEEGFFVAAEAIAEEINNRVINNGNILGGAENWLAQVGVAYTNRILSVVGSGKVDLYGTDFGWGRARKLETLSIDERSYTISLGKSRDGEGGLEVGLSLPKGIMDAFAAVFSDGMRGIMSSVVVSRL